MKLIYLVSSVYALSDYYPSVKNLIDANKVKIQEDYGPKPIKDVDTKLRSIPVASIAIHSVKIEEHSDEIARKFYNALSLSPNIRENSAYYTFGSAINSTESLKIETKNCFKKVCCQKIDNEKVQGFSEKKCIDTTNEKTSYSNCQEDKLCQMSAAHITSTHFNTTNLDKVVKNRFVVSWHGFSERKTVNNDKVDVIIGGKFKNGLDVAKEFVKLTKPMYLTVFCQAKDNCYTVPEGIRADVGSLEGAHDKNVVNTGRCRAGLHIELSNEFRTKGTDGHQKLVDAIKKYLPKSNSDISKSNDQC